MAMQGGMEKASAGMREIFSAFTASESRYFDEERYSESELRKALLDSFTDRKIDAMKRILAAVSVGRDASALFPDVVKNVSFQSLELKKLIYIYLVQYAENNRDLALLSINSFQKDLSDRSQLVRASALRAMASIKVLEVIQLVMVAVKTAANDSSPYVRKTAAQCMTKVYSVDPDQFFELRGLLLKLMSDHEVPVVGSAVMAFHNICVLQPPKLPDEGSADGSEGTGFLAPDAVVQKQLSLLHGHYKRLCQDRILMDCWAQQCCIDLLLRYCRLFFADPEQPSSVSAEGDGSNETAETAKAAPAMSEDLRIFLQAMKMLLNSSSQGVTLAASTTLCYLAPQQDLSVITKPLLRSLRQAPAESSNALLLALMPIIEARPELVRPSIREFFIQSFEFPATKELKLKVLEKLVDETNVQLVLRELQAYVSWHSSPDFVAQAVQSIAHVALKISSVADHCLRGLVKMLDSKCEALACEAVVALRALLQQRQQSADSGLGSVLPHLVRYLQDLKAPTARASVVWIIGQYQHEVPRLAPDVLRTLAKSFATERQEVKQQILGLSLKVWAFHLLNSKGEDVALHKPKDSPGSGKQPHKPVKPEESANLLPRLEALLEHIAKVASYDMAWDVRDTARALCRLKGAAQAGIADAAAPGPLEAFSLSYCRACITGTLLMDGKLMGKDAETKFANAGNEDSSGRMMDSQWILGSLAQALDFPLDTYRSLPAWAKENSPDELREVKVEAPSALSQPKSISSSNVGHVQHMEKRVQNPSNIQNAPQVTTLEELDLFYTEDTLPSKSPASAVPGAGDKAPAATLEQVRLGPVGTAVCGEDDESDEDEESDDDDDSWKYCQQASQVAQKPAQPEPAQPEPAGQPSFEPPPREPAPTEVPIEPQLTEESQLKEEAQLAEDFYAEPNAQKTEPQLNIEPQLTVEPQLTEAVLNEPATEQPAPQVVAGDFGQSSEPQTLEPQLTAEALDQPPNQVKPAEATPPDLL